MLIFPFKVKNNIFAPGSLSANNIFSTNVVYASGGNSNLWNSTYATVSSLSANNIFDGGNLKGANITIGTNDNFNLNLETSNATRMTVTSAGNVGIGATSPTEKLDVVGNVKVSGHFSAVTKSFLIDHPTKTDKKLQYGVVESNQHSVLVRGRTAKNVIELPEEWSGLVHENSITVQLTPVGTYQKLFVILQDNEKVVVGGSNGLYNYTIYGERKDVNRLQTEI